MGETVVRMALAGGLSGPTAVQSMTKNLASKNYYQAGSDFGSLWQQLFDVTYNAS